MASLNPPSLVVSGRASAQDVAAKVTSEIARLLEQGVMPWRAPWDRAKALAMTPGLPLRVTGEPYRGANVVFLWAAQIAHGFTRRTWLTYNQALKLGAQVRKGEKACSVIYYGHSVARDKDEGAETETKDSAYRFLKLFYVFNVDQIDGLPEDFGVETIFESIAPSAIENWAAACGARARIGGPIAFYAPSQDAIQMPPKPAFLSEEHWAATLLHELTHFTGHDSRLNRLADCSRDRKARAFEELIAEIGSAILGAMIGLSPHHLEDHAAYINDWLDALHDQPRTFLSAAAKAQAAVDWLIAAGGHLTTDTILGQFGSAVSFDCIDATLAKP